MSYSRALFISLLAHALLIFAGGRLVFSNFRADDALLLHANLRSAATPTLPPQPAVPPPASEKIVAKPSPFRPTVSRQSPPAVDAIPLVHTGSADYVAGDAIKGKDESVQTLAVADRASGESAPEAPSADGLRQYRVALAREARRYRHYPSLARVRGWEGVVEIQVRVRPDAPPSWGVVRTSGYEVLDEQALEMMGRAILAAALPESLRRRSFSLPVPIRFSLDD